MKIRKYKHDFFFYKNYSFFLLVPFSNPIFQECLHFDGARQRKRDTVSDEQKIPKWQVDLLRAFFYEYRTKGAFVMYR